MELEQLMRKERRIVVIGGGFAGVEVARSLERRLPRDWEIVLVSRENYITYNPLLAEAVGASVLPSHVVAPVRQMLRRTRFCMLTVTDIDLAAREIHYLGEGAGVLGFEQIVFACGANAKLDLVRGMENFALPLKTLGDALFIRNRIMVRLEHADMQSDTAMRRWLCSFIIVGGGFSGVEVAAELNDLLRGALPYYPRVSMADCRVVLVHSGERLLPELSQSLGELAGRRMRMQGIELRLMRRAASVDDRGVTLDDGELLAGGTVICTIGTEPVPLIESLPLPKTKGRITTAPDMSIPGHPGLWAIGDCAAIPNADDGALAPPTAQFAVREARQLADNVVRGMRGETTRPFSFRSQGQLCAIGHNKAVAEILGLRLHGFVAWLLWRAVYLLKLPTFSRKARIFLEWSWQIFFPPDIVHLRYSRTARNRPASVGEDAERAHA